MQLRYHYPLNNSKILSISEIFFINCCRLNKKKWRFIKLNLLSNLNLKFKLYCVLHNLTVTYCILVEILKIMIYFNVKNMRGFHTSSAWILQWLKHVKVFLSTTFSLIAFSKHYHFNLHFHLSNMHFNSFVKLF